PPDPAGERLAEEPAVGEEVDPRLGSLHLHGAEKVVPERLGRAAGLVHGRGVAEALDEREGLRAVLSLAEQEDGLGGLAGRQVEMDLERRARVEAGPDGV